MASADPCTYVYRQRDDTYTTMFGPPFMYHAVELIPGVSANVVVLVPLVPHTQTPSGRDAATA